MKLKKTKFCVVYYLLCIICLLFGLVLLPVWNNKVFWHDFGNKFIYMIIFFLLLLYLFGYLLNHTIKNKNKNVFVLNVVEFTLISVFTIMCLVNQFTGFMSNFITISKSVGLILYIHGFLNLFAKYLIHDHAGKEFAVKVVLFLLDIVLVSLGVYFLTNEVFKQNSFLWAVAIILFIVAISACVLGVLTTPKKSKKKK